MKARGAAIQGVLAMCGLSAAYATWQREPERAASEVVILDVGKNDLKGVRFDNDKSWVEVLREGGGDAPVWLLLSPKVDEKKPEGNKPERRLHGNEQATRLLDSFAPLRATRALGTVDAAKQKEFGLEAPKDKPLEKITVDARGEKRVFTVGKPAGSFAPYLRDERDGKVYLLGGSTISDLESASSRMVDRAMHEWKQTDYDALSVSTPAGPSTGEKRRELVVKDPEKGAAAKLAPKKSPDTVDDLAKNWHEKVWKLYTLDVLGQRETPAAGTPQVALRIDYAAKGAKKGYLELARLMVTPPIAAKTPAPTTPPAPVVKVYGRTEHTAGWVELSGTADELVKEGEKIAATE